MVITIFYLVQYGCYKVMLHPQDFRGQFQGSDQEFPGLRHVVLQVHDTG